jgi:hypothetical protein
VTSSVTIDATLSGSGSLPSAAFASPARAGPTPSTRTSLITRRAAGGNPFSPRLVTSTSTRLSGRTSPLTPAASLTRTAMARRSAAMVPSSPGAAPRGASAEARTGSPRVSATRVTRPATESGEVSASGGITRAGHGTCVSASRGTATPAGTSAASTTTARVGSRTGSAAALSRRYTENVATLAVSTAAPKMAV